MKRGGPLVRRTRLVAKTPLKSGGFLKRGAFIPKAAIKPTRPTVTPEERSARKLLTHRSGGRCEIGIGCLATDAHHRRNRSQGGLWAIENLLHLCRAHHHHITVNPQAAREQGWAVPSTRDPADVPVWLSGHGYCFLNTDGSITEAPEEEGVA